MARRRIEQVEKIKRNEQVKRVEQVIPTLKTLFAPKNDEQKKMIRTISQCYITLVCGTAGTGKSHVSIAYAISELLQKRCERIILTRPIVPAAGNEQIGLLPGTLIDKTFEYFAPLFSLLSQMISPEDIKVLTKSNGTEAKIKILPLAFMRGHTFENTIVIADEFQNSTIEQTRLLLTRLGNNSKIIICGDVDQSDIYGKNGLENACELLTGIEGIGFVTLTEQSIVRHPIIKEIEKRYNIQRKSKIKQ